MAINRLHLGNGAVYLADYLNIDIPAAKTFLAADRPDLVDRYVTTEDAYYARHADKTIETLRIGPLDQEYVCDRYGSFHFLPIDQPADEILVRHGFEHMSVSEARLALDLWSHAMTPKGILRIDVPDHDETMRLFASTLDPFYIRHLLGPRRGDDFGHHVLSYDRVGLIQLVESCGFRCVDEEKNIHFFPAFCLRFRCDVH